MKPDFDAAIARALLAHWGLETGWASSLGMSIKKARRKADLLRNLKRRKFSVDRVRIRSTVPKARLVQLLPLKKLRTRCHSFHVLHYNPKKPSGDSYIDFTCPQSSFFWDLMRKYESILDAYSIESLELAFDFEASSVQEALDLVVQLVLCLRKLRHVRGYLIAFKKNSGNPDPGKMDAPTMYFEKETSATALKIYARFKKGPNKTVDKTKPLARIERTLNYSSAIYSKTGIQRLEDIPSLDGMQFFLNQFRLERPRLHRLGRLLLHGKSTHNYSELGAALNLAYLKARAESKKRPQDFEQAHFKWMCASQIRGFLNHIRKTQESKPGPRSKRRKKKPDLTRYLIDTAFEDITPKW